MKEKTCEYCKEDKYSKVKSVELIYHYENPEAYGFPEVVYWDEKYSTDGCPICKRKIFIES